MTPVVESHIRCLRWISETERYLARAREHAARFPDDSEIPLAIHMVEDALAKVRSEIGIRGEGACNTP
jgi:hypothetical protein